MNLHEELAAKDSHIALQASRIAELEAQIAASADTDKLREEIRNVEISTSGSKGYFKAWNEGAEHMRDAILNLIESTALQAPVREVPEGWQLVPTWPTQEMVMAARAKGTASTKAEIWSVMLAAAPLPAAPVQESKP